MPTKRLLRVLRYYWRKHWWLRPPRPGGVDDEPYYPQAFIDECAKRCKCCSYCRDVPCDDALGGGCFGSRCTCEEDGHDRPYDEDDDDGGFVGAGLDGW